MDFIRLEAQLKERLDLPYSWGRKQSNEWDSKTNFIYTTYSFRKLLEITANFDIDEKNYTFNRWYNFWSAIAIEKLFSLHQNVTPNINKYDKLIDFSINNISFDHKTTVFPQGFNKTIDYAKQNPLELITWLYLNQSQEGRKHLKNRLFIVIIDKNNEHWKLKSEIALIKTQIDIYVENFAEQKLISLTIENQKILSDIIWVAN
ncbi:MAG TPA: hypothetical protein DCM02_12155 [Flavobacterium sp.]|nr:hypothetical protein [Flavobacterium sp.]